MPKASPMLEEEQQPFLRTHRNRHGSQRPKNLEPMGRCTDPRAADGGDTSMGIQDICTPGCFCFGFCWWMS